MSKKAGKPRRGQAEQVRAKIDAGKLGDKVDAFDPAAAPLGTDDEAGSSGAHADDLLRSAERQERVAASFRGAPTGRRRLLLLGASAAVAGLIALLVLATLPQ